MKLAAYLKLGISVSVMSFLVSCASTNNTVTIPPADIDTPVSASGYFFERDGTVVSPDEYETVRHFSFRKEFPGRIHASSRSEFNLTDDFMNLVAENQADALVNVNLVASKLDPGNQAIVDGLVLTGWVSVGFAAIFQVLNLAIFGQEKSMFDAWPAVAAGIGGGLFLVSIPLAQKPNTLVINAEGDAVKRLQSGISLNPKSADAINDGTMNNSVVSEKTELAEAKPAGVAQELPSASRLPTATIKIDGKLDDWNQITPAFLNSSGENRGNLGIDKVYLAVDSKNLYLRFDIQDHSPSSFSHPHNFDSRHNTSYGMDIKYDIEHIILDVNYWEGRKDRPWAVQILRKENDKFKELSSTTHLAMKGFSLEAAFPLELFKKYLGPLAGGAYCNVSARIGYEDLNNPRNHWVNADFAPTKRFAF